MIFSYLWAQAGQQAPQGNIWGSLIMIALIFIIFYLLLILPARRRQKKHMEMVQALKPGDRVVTAGGIIGTIERVYEDKIELNSGGTKLEILKTSVANVLNKAGK